MARPGVWYAMLAVGVALLALAGYGGYVLYPRFGLPAVSGGALLVLAAGAGIASFFSPCSFPLLATLLAREAGGRQTARAVRFAAALSFGAGAFLLLAGIGVAFGAGALFAEVTFTSVAGKTIRALVGLGLIALGLIQLGVVNLSFHGIDRLVRPLMRYQAGERRERPILGYAALGFGYVLAGFG
ncbi:MAG: cytochrome c biogenesis protein CcdA [Candidatus Limnocylindria bacterium]